MSTPTLRITAPVSTAAALRTASEPPRPCASKSACREIFRNRTPSRGRSAGYRFVASRDFAYVYEKPRQDRQSLQTDPIGYDAGLNWYVYVGNDPINASDPSGLCTGSRITNDDGTCASTGGFTTGSDGVVQGVLASRARQSSETLVFAIAIVGSPVAEGDGGIEPVIIGTIAEGRIEAWLVAQGYEVWSQVPARLEGDTCFLFCYERRYDFAIQNRAELETYLGVEVKGSLLGQFRPNGRQIAFDAAVIRGMGAIVQRGPLEGERITDVRYYLYRLSMGRTPPPINPAAIERAFAREGVTFVFGR